MNNVVILSRVALRGSFFRQGNKTQAWLPLLIAFCAIMFALSCAGSAALMHDQFEAQGYAVRTLPVMSAVAALVCFVVSIARTPTLLFGGKDHDLLMSMPVTPGQVSAARLVTLYAFDLLIAAVFVLPTIVIEIVMGGMGVLGVFASLAAMVFVPLIPLTLAAFLGFFISLFSAKFRAARVVRTILAMLALLLYMGINFSMGNIMTEGLPALGGVILRYYPPAQWLEWTLLGAWWWLPVFAAASAFTLYLFGRAISSSRFNEINERLLAGTRAKPAAKGRGNAGVRPRSPMSALLMREGKRFFHTTIYFVNTAFGPILMAALPLVFLIMGADAIEEATKMQGVADAMRDYAPLIFTFGPILCLTTTSSISLEGRSFWQIVSLPVSVKTILLSKVIFNLIVSLPVTVLAGLLAWPAFQLNGYMALMCVVLPVLAGVFAALWGLVSNLCYPKMDWANETEVVKQSSASMMGVLGCMGFLGLSAALYFILPEFLRLPGLCVYYIALSAVAGAWLLRNGKEKFAEIN